MGLMQPSRCILIEDGVMRGYTSSSYGDAFADVYDDWYREVTDIAATVDTVAGLIRAGAAVLELGVGTGRLAVPLAAAGYCVTGIDTSTGMLARLADNDPTGSVSAVTGDMVDDVPAGPFDLILVAYNTLFGLLTAQRQIDCFKAVAERLTAGGVFFVEAFVPVPHSGSQVSVRSVTADRVVLSTSIHRADVQMAEGQYVELTERGGVRLRPWAIRWSTVDELDTMADLAGLRVRDRWGDVDQRPFTTESERHVTIYEHAPHPQRASSGT